MSSFRSVTTRAVTRLHVLLYRAFRGAGVGRMGKAPILLLTVRGRRSGVPQTVPLLYLRDGEAYVVVASYGGAPKHPSWYLNLSASPEVEIEVRDTRIAAVARTASDIERERYWPQLVALYARYADYQTKTERTIPVVILETRSET